MSNSIGITAYSTALFSTWFYVEPFGVLFDCGDGITNTLLQKARKIRNVFISHADRDHLTGLFQFNQLNGRKELSIHYPKDCGSFPAIEKFTSKFDPHTVDSNWIPISAGDVIPIRDNVSIKSFENRHVSKKNPSQTKSLSYSIQTTRTKLKSEFANLTGPEIAALRKEKDDELIFDRVTDIELTYSGDTPVEFDGRYSDSRILIHESTFLNRDELQTGEGSRNPHSSLDLVMEMVSNSNVEQLILSHFSSRYSDAEIDEAIERERDKFAISIPIHVIYPGRVARFDI